MAGPTPDEWRALETERAAGSYMGSRDRPRDLWPVVIMLGGIVQQLARIADALEVEHPPVIVATEREDAW